MFPCNTGGLPAGFSRSAKCLLETLSVSHRLGFARLWKSAPERLHIDGRLEHEEKVSAIVGVEHLAICAKVLGTERTAVPLADDTSHMPVAESKGMCEVTEISCFDVGEQLQHTRASEVMLHTCGVTRYICRRAAWCGSSRISISARRNRALELSFYSHSPKHVSQTRSV